MPVFSYKGFDAKGKAVSGVKDADNVKALRVNLIRDGEVSGNHDAVMFRLAEFLDNQNKLRSKVISALFYPIVMTIIGALIMSILMVSVVPKVTSIFADTGQALPWNTQLLIGI